MLKIMLAAALAAAALGTPASAQDDRTRRVSYADLHLDREGDVRTLDRRIGRAVRDACGVAADYDVRGKNEARRCRAETRAAVTAERDRLVAAARPTAVAAR
ncbi:UrcA family protein [Sphingomonas lenta]|uniref:UrcA family protein n=1 Tax=Sphingomonas lenta TaxID=1141887 RepID=A0A2A2SJD4_9SPHN|nr:UrcA family protein [Sphingomonas lenta]PAX09339.1 UrcA family protein [Sphingomonas lenta]